MGDHASYRHVQPFTALWLLPLPVLPALVAVAMADGPSAYLAVPLIVAPIPLLLLFLGRLVIEIRGEHLQWAFGFVGWPRWRVALADIRDIEVTRARGLQGAGIQGTRRERLYNASLGGPVVRLVLQDGRSVALGTPEPQRLASFIRARQPGARR